jgi:hypothetical protein
MRCQWHRIQGVCSVTDTSCTCACGINDTACTVHAVTMTLHARCMRCHLNRMHGACGIIDTMTPHAKYDTACTIDERFERPWQPLKSIKKIYVPEFSYPTTKKYINLKGLPNKKFSCMLCHWHRMHNFCVQQSIISRRIQSRIQKVFSLWIRGPGGIVWWKKPKVKNLVTLSLSVC